MGKHKPIKVVENMETGEKESITYPDERTLKVRGLQESGMTHAEIAKELEIGEGTVCRELKLFQDTIGRVFNPDDIRSELQAYIGLAKVDVQQGMSKGTGTIGLRFLEGMGVLSQKLQIGTDKNATPPESQVKELVAQLAQVPAYRLLMLEALGLSEPVEQAEPIDTTYEEVQDQSPPVHGGG